MAHPYSGFDDSGYEADDECRSRRVISRTLFRTTPFINPFDETVPVSMSSPPDQRPQSINDVCDSMDTDIVDTVQAPIPTALKFILANNECHSNSKLEDGGGKVSSSISSGATNIYSRVQPLEETGDNSNHTPASFIHSNSQLEDGDGIAPRDCSSQDTISFPANINTMQTHEEARDYSNRTRTKIVHQKNLDGDNINTSDRVSDNKHISRKRGAPARSDDEAAKRKKGFIGVHHYKRTNRWEAYMWYPKQKEQLWFGQHFIVEAAARTSDKAQLVLRNRSERKLNYPEEDYDMNYIQKWKGLDLKDFEEALRVQSKNNSEGCILGLRDKAANVLRQQINEFKTFMKARTNNRCVT